MPRKSIPHRLAVSLCLLSLQVALSPEPAAADFVSARRDMVHVPLAKPAPEDLTTAVEPASGPTGDGISSLVRPGLVIRVDRNTDPLQGQMERGLIDRRDARHQTALLRRAIERQRETGDLYLTAKLTGLFDLFGEIALLLDDAEGARLAQERALDLYDVLPVERANLGDVEAARLRALDRWADLNFRLGTFDVAALAYQEIAESTIALGERQGALETTWPRVARTMIKLAASRQESGDRRGAVQAFEAAGFITQALLSDARTLPASHRPLAMQLAFIERRIGEIGGGIETREAPVEQDVDGERT